MTLEVKWAVNPPPQTFHPIHTPSLIHLPFKLLQDPFIAFYYIFLP